MPALFVEQEIRDEETGDNEKDFYSKWAEVEHQACLWIEGLECRRFAKMSKDNQQDGDSPATVQRRNAMRAYLLRTTGCFLRKHQSLSCEQRD